MLIRKPGLRRASGGRKIAVHGFSALAPSMGRRSGSRWLHLCIEKVILSYRRTKKSFTLTLLILTLILSAAAAFATPLLAHNHIQHSTAAIPLAPLYVGSSNTGKFHYTDCTWSSKISAYHRVYFESRQEAINDGYVPCEVCKP